MIARTLSHTVWLALASALVVPAAHGQAPIGSFASIVGAVEVQRGGQGEWLPAAVGSAVQPTDAVRSAPNAYAKLMFVDDAVVDLGASTQLTVERYGGGRRERGSLLRLDQGALEAWIGHSGGEGTRWEAETPTAVVRVQSTNFILRYDPVAKATDVVGIEGSVTVQGTTGIIGPGVMVGPDQMTHVPLDGFPSPAKTVDDAQANASVQGLRRLGVGTRDGLDVDNPIIEGRVVAPNDRPSVTVAGGPVEDVYLRPEVPGQTLLDSLSPDARANTQPLPVYRAVPPNQSPNPPH